MMQNMNYNQQFGGFDPQANFFNPYGMGGGMPSVSSMQFGGGYPGMGSGMPFFSGMQTGGGYPSMDMMGGGYATSHVMPSSTGPGGYSAMAPGGFMNNFQSQLQDMFSKYFNQGQVAIDPAVGPAPTAPSAATTPTTPDFGNLGARFDRDKTLTNKANKKLNNMGYTNNQIVDARQAGGGKAGFQAALGGMQPGR
jgi:hypothetical protein